MCFYLKLRSFCCVFTFRLQFKLVDLFENATTSFSCKRVKCNFWKLFNNSNPNYQSFSSLPCKQKMKTQQHDCGFKWKRIRVNWHNENASISVQFRKRTYVNGRGLILTHQESLCPFHLATPPACYRLCPHCLLPDLEE